MTRGSRTGVLAVGLALASACGDTGPAAGETDGDTASEGGSSGGGSVGPGTGETPDPADACAGGGPSGSQLRQPDLEWPVFEAGSGALAIEPAGDFDGDGAADLIVGVDAMFTSAWGIVLGGPQVGQVSVEEAFQGTDVVLLSDAGLQSPVGVPSNGAIRPDAVAAGDLNGDGIGDVVLGQPYRESGTFSQVGGALVVFGDSSHDPVDLAAIEAGAGRGFPIRGGPGQAGSQAGGRLAFPGDFNGDGLDDVLLYADPVWIIGDDDVTPPERAWVVHGRTGTDPVGLADVEMGVGGSWMVGSSSWPTYPAGPAGDVNGDGLDDLALGSLVVHGVAGGSVFLADVAKGQGGFLVTPEAPHLGRVSIAGGRNLPGGPTLVVSDTIGGYCFGGRAYRVGGKTDTAPLDLAEVAAGAGNHVEASAGLYATTAVAGDVDGDGELDLVGIQLRFLNEDVIQRTGFVLRGGGAWPATLDEAMDAGRAYAIELPPNLEQWINLWPMGPGDLNGDGLDDAVWASHQMILVSWGAEL